MNKKKIIILIIIILITIAIFLTRILVKTPQDIRKKAFGTQEISIVISPEGNSHARNSTFEATINLVNNSSQKQIYVAGVDINFDTNIFDVSNINCDNIFSTSYLHEVQGNKIHLTCFKSGGEQPITIPQQGTITLGTFTLSVKNTAPLGTTNLTVGRGIIPDANSPYEDLAKEPNPTEYTITENGEITPTSVFTPTTSPTTQPSPTRNTPTPPDPECHIPTPATTTQFINWKQEFKNPSPASYPSDFNCDGVIDLIDFEIWRKEYSNNL